MPNSVITPSFVKETLSTKLSDSEIEGAIATALVLYRNHLSSRNLPNDLQLEITRYLAAHFVSLRDQTAAISEEKIGDAQIKYGGYLASDSNTDKEGLRTTAWGQTAIALDPTGVLGKLGKTPIRFVAL